ncbi:hypothetical protein L6164_010927 [Bauhinia variegata]|uniref:Uncharacterized protein n=1 Tax=Bauhinia variegata TaxID=167791 RepID=A0ACB9P526_BAUVA|nr:hypothetical protein L6164_010927 [Bauhinia variegata]
MKSISIEEREGRLEQLYNDLEQRWDAYKQSYSKTSRSHRYSHSEVHSNTIEAIHLRSSRLLMDKLQQLLRTTNDLAVQEIIQERKEAIERGTLKGRRLFHSTNPESELSFLSNVMGQDCEVSSLYFCSSDDDEHYGNNYLSSSSSTPCLSHDFAGKQLTMAADKRVHNDYVIRPGIENGSRCIVFLSAGIAIALLIFAVCMKSAKSLGGYEVIPVPT